MRFVHSASGSVRMSTPPSSIEPSFTSHREAMRRAIVDLPLPEGPTNALTVPGSMCKLTPWSTALS